MQVQPQAVPLQEAQRPEGQLPVVQNRHWYENIGQTVSQLAYRVSTIARSTLSTCTYYISLPLKKLVVHAVLPAVDQNMNDPQFVEWRREYLADIPPNSEKSLDIGNNTILSGFKLSQPEKEGTPLRHTIFFNGNGMTAETALTQCLHLQQEMQTTVTCYSYPGTGLSTGRVLCEEDLLVYGRAVIDNVLSTLTPNTQLVLHGWSLGGGLATLLTKEYEARGVSLVLVNDRSFTELAEVVKYLLPNVVRSIATFIMNQLGWSLNAKAAVESIRRSKILVITAPRDEIIRARSKFINTFPEPVPPNVTTYELPTYYGHGGAYHDDSTFQNYNRFLTAR